MQRMFLRRDGSGALVPWTVSDRLARAAGGAATSRRRRAAPPAPRLHPAHAAANDARRLKPIGCRTASIVLDTPVTLPPVLDLLIVGGGPVGTACAFRAKELGLAALVIEMDDLMKRIRDYAKDKPILPDYGGGDTMEFPAGGELVGGAAVRADRQGSNGRAVEGAVPAISACRRRSASSCSQVERQRRRDVARGLPQPLHEAEPVVRQPQRSCSALGRGVPRRLDIPGNVAGPGRCGSIDAAAVRRRARPASSAAARRRPRR